MMIRWGEVTRGRRLAYQAALASLDGEGSRLAEALRVELEWRLRNRGRAPKKPPAPGEGLRMHAVGAARRAILAMRKSGEIGDVAFHRLEEEMDRIELSAT
jgi:CPA1 family monovalent cation:H+ antiporter